MAWPDPDNTTTVETSTDPQSNVLLDDLIVDALIREDPSEPLLVTSHPVEIGEDFSEYVVELPATLVIDCVFRDDPFGAPDNTVANVTEATGVTPMTWQEKRDYVIEKKRKFWRWTISTGYDVYPNYVLIDYYLDRRAETGLSWKVQLIFQHVRNVDQQVSTIPLDQIPVLRRSQKLKTGARRGQGKKHLGESPSKDLTDKESEEVKALLDELLGKGTTT